MHYIHNMALRFFAVTKQRDMKKRKRRKKTKKLRIFLIIKKVSNKNLLLMISHDLAFKYTSNRTNCMFFVKKIKKFGPEPEYMLFSWL